MEKVRKGGSFWRTQCDARTDAVSQERKCAGGAFMYNEHRGRDVRV